MGKNVDASGRDRSILLICGSLRAESVNSAVLQTARELGAERVRMISYSGAAQLPHFDPNLGEDLPAAVAELRRSIDAASALLFSTPEYAGAMPGLLKTLLEWTVGGVEISDKPTGWINPSTGPTRAAGTYASLDTVLNYTGAAVIPSACVTVPVRRALIDPSGRVADPAVRAAIGSAVAALIDAVG